MKYTNLSVSKICIMIIFVNSQIFVMADSLTMAHGWSVNPKGGIPAIQEAISMMKEKVAAPDFIVVYYTANYGDNHIHAELRRQFPEAKLFGMNVYRGVFSSDGLHLGDGGSLAIMGYQGSDFSFGVSVKKLDTGTDVIATTKEAVKDAVKDAGMETTDAPAVVLLGTAKGSEDTIIEGLNSVLPKSVSLVGGTACDNDYRPGYVFDRDSLVKPGVVVGLIYSKKKIGASFYAGFIGKKKSGKITSGNGRLLAEIDGRPAQQVYREWAHGHFDDIDASQESVMVMSSSVCPLAKAIRLPNGKLRYIAVRPWKFNPDGSMNMGGDIHNGEMIYFVEGNNRVLKKRAGVVAKNALIDGKIKIKDIAGGIHIYCGGAANVLGFGEDGETTAMVSQIKDVLGEKPFIGAFTAGEQGDIKDYGFFHGNLMSSMVIFSE